MAERIRGPRAVVGIRRRLVEASVPKWEADYRRYFGRLTRAILGPKGKAGPLSTADLHAVQSYYLSKIKSGSAEMKPELKKVLTSQYLGMTETVWTDVVSQQVGRAISFDLNARGVGTILDRVGTRITQIDQSSQRMAASYVQREIERGSNADRLEANLRGLLQSWGESGGRAHIIALTETANAYNLAAVNGYRESGLVDTVQVYDGPECGWTEHDDPDLADGSTRTLEEADQYPEAHPHCQRAFGPVVAGADAEQEQEPGTISPEAEPPPEPDATPLEDVLPPEPPEPPAPTEDELMLQQIQAVAGDGLRLDGREIQVLHEGMARAYEPFGRSLNPLQESAVGNYRSSGYRLINKYWYDRPGVVRSALPGQVESVVRDSKALDSVLRTAPGMPDNLVVYRGMGSSVLPKRTTVGRVITNKGYTSTSIDGSRAIEFSGSRQEAVILRILVPKGRSAYYMDHLVRPYENELLLPRWSRFRILADKTETTSSGLRRRVLDVVLEERKKKEAAEMAAAWKAARDLPRLGPAPDVDYWGWNEGEVEIS